MELKYSISELDSFTDKDLMTIRDLVGQMSPDGQELTDDDLGSMIDDPSTHLYLARMEDSQQIIGMVTLITYRIPYKMKGWVEDLVVDKEYRGKGVATKLLQYVIDEARKYQVISLNLTSNPAREGANQLYLKMGFVKRDTNVYRIML